MELIEVRAIELIVLVVAFLIGKYILPLIKVHVNTQQLTLALSYALSFVKGAEAIYDGEGRGEEKLKYVSMQMSKKLYDLGISMDETEIRAIIEQAVQVMKEDSN